MTDQLQEDFEPDEMPEEDQPEVDAPELDATENEEPEAESDEVEISFGDEPEQEEEANPEPAPKWVRDLREQNRELKRRLKEVEATKEQKQQTLELGPKPTLEAVDYDADKFEAELLAWNNRKAEIDAKAKARREEEEAAQAEWTKRLETYSEAKKTLRVRDFDDAEDSLRDILSVTQQGIVLQAADEPAKLVYALGRNPKRAKEIAGIKDPVRFAAAVAKLEVSLKVTTRKPSVAPESRPSGASRGTGSFESTLDRLREEAAKTGDYSKVHAFKLKAKQR